MAHRPDLGDWAAFHHHAVEVDPGRIRSLQRALNAARSYGGFRDFDQLASRWLPDQAIAADDFFQPDPDMSWRLQALLHHCRIPERPDFGTGENPMLRHGEPPNLVSSDKPWHTWKGSGLEEATQVHVASARSIPVPRLDPGAARDRLIRWFSERGVEDPGKEASKTLRIWTQESEVACERYATALKRIGRKKGWVMTWREASLRA